ncbi:hypothetical protein A3B18_02805 [Candidatus Giovannonibacteria bacterium RIFCSPLOWO2_01_FULL_46_13]|uniref:Glycosyltransferase 2-like domain-containing protein n=1 Tax=Candidatus Giovannonibacteria bacterium RIFCSPLOWO2_01_FULL_46_13 TaxID=1798352 RepID=A0A1F5X2W1_9BACT|nr:MAG: hypothetical protein A3B18_02805 [Candidatus Giovannonibacteria bacterium RIFCSPLOWO2_01_FULL_46_13]
MTIDKEKFVTIGMPVRNGSERLHVSLDSLLAQTHKNFEFLISDNASTDNTEEIIKNYQEKDNRIKYFRQPENIGFVRNAAFVLNKSSAEYFMWASHDDWWAPTFIEKMIEALEKNPDYGAAMSHFKAIRDDKVEPEDAPGGYHNFTDMSNLKLYRTMLASKSNPIYEFALWRREYLARLYKRLKPSSIEDTVILISEAALGTKFYSVKEFLHAKYRNPQPLKVRHAYLGGYYDYSFPHTNYLWTILTRHITSPVIPFYRKAMIFGPWLGRAWLFKRKVLNEFISWAGLKNSQDAK